MDAASNWMLEFTVPGPNPLVVNVVNPKAIPRGVMFVCGLQASPAHDVAFKALDEATRRKFWHDMRRSLSREPHATVNGPRRRNIRQGV